MRTPTNDTAHAIPIEKKTTPAARIDFAGISYLRRDTLHIHGRHRRHSDIAIMVLVVMVDKSSAGRLNLVIANAKAGETPVRIQPTLPH